MIILWSILFLVRKIQNTHGLFVISFDDLSQSTNNVFIHNETNDHLTNFHTKNTHQFEIVKHFLNLIQHDIWKCIPNISQLNLHCNYNFFFHILNSTQWNRFFYDRVCKQQRICFYLYSLAFFKHNCKYKRNIDHTTSEKKTQLIF